jgi:hypothetical protein
MEGGNLTDLAVAAAAGAGGQTLSDIPSKVSALLAQVAALTGVISNANAVVINAQTSIVGDCAEKVRTGLSSAVQEATTAAEAAANAVCDSRLANLNTMSNSDNIASGQPIDDVNSEEFVGGGRSACKCQCKCNIKTRRRKRAKRSKSRVRR